MIYTLGETVIDLIFKDMKPLSAKVGGSALNTAVSLGRLGDAVAFVSEIGADKFGGWCEEFLKENAVGVEHLVRYPDKKSSLALAFLDAENNATYNFYKEFSAPFDAVDVRFASEDVLLFSSSFAINRRVRGAVVGMAQAARSCGAMVMYDPNMRKRVGADSEEWALLRENFSFARIVHLSDEDADAIFGERDAQSVFERLKPFGVEVLVFTQNKDDVFVVSSEFALRFPVPRIEPVSTIGAGDTFNAGVLHCVNAGGDIASPTFWQRTIPFAIRASHDVCMSLDNYVSVGFR